MGSLTINLLGTSFKISANQDSQYLQKLLTYYTGIIDNLKESLSGQDPLQIAILAGIMLTDELYTQKSPSNTQQIVPQTTSVLSEVENITTKLINSIDQVLSAAAMQSSRDAPEPEMVQPVCFLRACKCL